ncbi:MAG: DUF971 domain-containing protein [Candidatus Omnitrophota bacterium]|jgi:DUF971 family protein|nr:MAG: DUF971 domain-containing protein [Candidatus Omnitrophota bacterium]
MGAFPTQLQRIDGGRLLIVWSDGAKREYSIWDLRNHCPCAQCRGEDLAIPLSSQEYTRQIPVSDDRTINIVAMKPVGNYAYAIDFSDGHKTGIFTFDLLRQLGQNVDV